MKHLTLIKVVLFLACLSPLGLVVFDGFQHNLSADPIKEILHRTGIWSLRLLLITLAMTPMKTLTGSALFIRIRRQLGLFTFFYASLHLLTYLWLDLGFAWNHFFEDIIDRPYITVGMLAWAMMLPMAITSNKRMIRALGKRWKRLHQMIYLVLVLSCLHFLWLVKSDLTEPLIYSGIGVTWLLFRLLHFYHGKQSSNPQKTSQHSA